MVKKELAYDSGYGLIGNLTKIILLNDIFSEEDSKEYRKKLKKEDPKKYEQFLEFEKEYGKI